MEGRLARQSGRDRGERRVNLQSPDRPTTLTVDSSILGWLDAPVELVVETRVVDGVTIRTASAVTTHPVFEKTTRGLNGQSRRANGEFFSAAKNHRLTRRISGVQAIRHPNTSTPIIGVQSGDHSPNTRVRAFFAIVGPIGDPVYVHVANCVAIEDRKILGALETAGYDRAQRTGRV